MLVFASKPHVVWHLNSLVVSDFGIVNFSEQFILLILLINLLDTYSYLFFLSCRSLFFLRYSFSGLSLLFLWWLLPSEDFFACHSNESFPKILWFDFREPLTVFGRMEIVYWHRVASFLFWKVRMFLKTVTYLPSFH